VPSGPQMLTASGLKKRYGGRAVVNGVDLEVKRGEVVGLLGRNGAGKTTSFYMMIGLVKPDEGRIALDRREVTNWPMHKRARAGMGYLAQGESIFLKLSVEDNVRAILELTSLSKKERDERCYELLDDFDLLERRRLPGYALSGGERRRTEIARALATDPAFILLDEPFTGIDPKNVEEIQQVVRRLKKRGLGVLITDHNVYDTLDIIDRGYVLHDGEIMMHGSPREMLSDERARALYFGEKISSDRYNTDGQKP
jgi:lipopolysaccharide export system ATP-binding protein